MKEVVYKFSHEEYQNIEYQDQTDVDFIPYYHPRKKNKATFHYKSSNQDQDFYIQNYGNPLCEVKKIYGMVVVEKSEDKVSWKLFTGSRHRRPGVFWFKTVKNLKYITVNLKTGDVYSGTLSNYQKKKKFTKTLRRNSFQENPIQNSKSIVKNYFVSLSGDGYFPANESIKKFLDIIDGGRFSDSISDEDRLLKFYLDKRKVKYPNNFGLYREFFSLKEAKKILKKNDSKLVESFMIHQNLTGKKIKKALHSCQKLNVILLKDAKKLFGNDWIHQEPNFIENCLNYKINSFFFGIGQLGEQSNFTKEELKKIYNIFKLTYFDLEIDEYTFRDHLGIYSQLKRYGFDVKWKSTNASEFRVEHLDWSNTLDFYKRGEYTRTYPQHYYQLLKKPIVIDDVSYHPVILDKTSNYNEETDCQSNCVKTYIGRSNSIIISLRKFQPTSDIRATIQYELFKDKETNKINIDRVQFLGRFNKSLELEWNKALLKLDEIMLSCVRDKRYSNVKISKKCANGILLESDSDWNEETGKLRWTYKEIEHEL